MHMPVFNRRACLMLALTATTAACGSAPDVVSQPSRTIADVLSSDSSFERFLAAAGPSGALQTLRGPGPFTVFAFTNSGWADLPAFTRDSLMSGTEPTRLAAVMNHLIVEGRHTIASMGGEPKTFTTRNGSRITVDPRNAERPSVESAGGGGQGAGVASVGLRSSRIQRPDVEASNGIIHVMTGIIVP